MVHHVLHCNLTAGSSLHSRGTRMKTRFMYGTCELQWWGLCPHIIIFFLSFTSSSLFEKFFLDTNSIVVIHYSVFIFACIRLLFIDLRTSRLEEKLVRKTHTHTRITHWLTFTDGVCVFVPFVCNTRDTSFTCNSFLPFSLMMESLNSEIRTTCLMNRRGFCSSFLFTALSVMTKRRHKMHKS